MSESELRARCATIALSGLVRQPAGAWTLTDTALEHIRAELGRAASSLPRVLQTFGMVAMWLPSYRPGTEAARDAILGVLADWLPATTMSPGDEMLGRFSRRALPPAGSRKALPGAQFALGKALGGSGR